MFGRSFLRRKKRKERLRDLTREDGGLFGRRPRMARHADELEEAVEAAERAEREARASKQDPKIVRHETTAALEDTVRDLYAAERPEEGEADAKPAGHKPHAPQLKIRPGPDALHVREAERRRAQEEGPRSRLTGGPRRETPLAGLSPLDLLALAVGQREPDEAQLQQETDERLQRIRVIAFVGPSGTGKSTQAVKLARERRIDYIIDDGLLVYGGRVVAGTSAKRAPTKMESVRQALFSNEARASTMRRALSEHEPETLMILGTSDGMLDRICRNLHLRPPEQIIRIEDVTTEDERRLAKTIRMTQGQHTIPVPSMEIKHEFSGSLSIPFWRLRSRLSQSLGAPESDMAPTEEDRTVVRPTFSTLGSYSISDEALKRMIVIMSRSVEGLADIIACEINKVTYGVVIYAELALYYGYEAQTVMQTFQSVVKRGLESLTFINVLIVHVSARKVVHGTEAQAAAHAERVRMASKE